MATKRIAQSAVNWAAIAERVPEHQRQHFLAFKSRSDLYLRRAMSLPEKPPAINWDFYKQKVPVAGMVDEFKNKYSALNIPFPPDNVSGQIDAQEKAIKADIEKFKAESNARIENYKKELAHIAGLLPYDQMTMEDYRDAYPAEALDPINKPTFWPHTPEEQVDYVDKDAQPQGHH
ncbi:ATP synthase subunit d, mitochondrial [Anthonomus grandis grandis]|uniref:ATP synthase subunit d, mitochondrial n=1 Tax=Anthonomus grandis grandis TaxID=2921223 RepID=UPI002165D742|nr:ATP synthase subunit d, mitochondrial [Anthonomus grandis grandis]